MSKPSVLKRPSREARDAMTDEVFLDWAQMWVHHRPLGVVDVARARAILETQLKCKVPWDRPYVIWLLANPGTRLPHNPRILHLDGDKKNDAPENLLALPLHMAASSTVREWWRKNAQRKRVVYSRD